MDITTFSTVHNMFYITTSTQKEFYSIKYIHYVLCWDVITKRQNHHRRSLSFILAMKEQLNATHNSFSIYIQYITFSLSRVFSPHIIRYDDR